MQAKEASRRQTQVVERKELPMARPLAVRSQAGEQVHHPAQSASRRRMYIEVVMQVSARDSRLVALHCTEYLAIRPTRIVRTRRKERV